MVVSMKSLVIIIASVLDRELSVVLEAMPNLISMDRESSVVLEAMLNLMSMDRESSDMSMVSLPTKEPATKEPATRELATKQPPTREPATKRPPTREPATRRSQRSVKSRLKGRSSTTSSQSKS